MTGTDVTGFCAFFSARKSSRVVQSVCNLSIGVTSTNSRTHLFTKTNQKLEKAVAVSGVCSGVLRENSGKVPGKLVEKCSQIAKCYKF